MKNQISVFAGSDEYICTQFYDTDSGQNGIEIKDSVTDKIIGTMMNISIPEFDDDDWYNKSIDFDRDVREYIETL